MTNYYDTPPAITNGPDPRHPSLKCKQYHERPPCQSGNLHQHCCCDPCLYIRSAGNQDIMYLTGPYPPWDSAECCRCVPRAIFFRFTPTDEEGECCYSQSVLVWADVPRSNEEDASWVKAVYTTAMYGLTITLMVGRFSSTGTGTEAAGEMNSGNLGSCAWVVEIYDGNEILYYEEFPIETSGTGTGTGGGTMAECLYPPDFQFGPIDGPPGCTNGGYLTFQQWIKNKLPYVLRSDEDPDAYLPKFIDLCPSGCEGGPTGTGTGAEIPDCLAVQDASIYVRRYTQVGDVNGYAAYEYVGDQTYKIQWSLTEGTWVQLDGSNAIIGTGGTDPTCPLGVWTTYPYGVPFCVSWCDPGGEPTETPTSFVCGQCEQSCSRVCVSGNWRERGWEFLEFTWTKELVWITDETGTGQVESIKQGWTYTDPDTSGVESLWLTSSDGVCVLETDFTSNNFADIEMTTGCSCTLRESSQDDPLEGGTYWYAVHCGLCSCYQFYCGSCRCVPDKLCLSWYLDGDFTQSQVLSWDEDLKQWGDDSSDLFTVHLERGDNGECQLSLYANWFNDTGTGTYAWTGTGTATEALYLWVPEDPTDTLSDMVYERQYDVFDCRKEAWVFHTDPGYDGEVLISTVEGVRATRRIKCLKYISDIAFIDIFGFLEEGERPLWIYGTSLTDECRTPSCDSILVSQCHSECVDEPDILHATIQGRRISGDPPAVTVSWSADIVLYKTIQFSGASFDPPSFYCAYIGSIGVSCEIDGALVEEIWTVREQEGGLSVDFRYWTKDGANLVSKYHFKTFTTTVTESCDPFYYETDWEEIGVDALDGFIPGIHCTQLLTEDERAFEVKLILTL